MFKNEKIFKPIHTLLYAISVFSLLLFSCGGASDSKGNADSLKTEEESPGLSDLPDGKKYEIKSGVVHYKPIEVMKGSKTQEILYFDDYGRKEARFTTTEINIMGITTKEKSVSITDGDYSITYAIEKIENGKNVTEKVARKVKISGNLAQMGLAMALSTDMKKLVDEFDYREEGTETVAGLNGKKISMALNKEKKNERIFAVTYKNILLKSEVMGIKIEAEKVEENASVPSHIFSIPEGYTIEEVNMDDLMENMN
jgi:hypothetical protein